MSSILILSSLLLLLLLRVPVAFSLGGLGLFLLILKGFTLTMVPLALFSSMDSFILLAVPLFLLMSNVLLKGGIGRDLFRAVQSWVGHWPGGLGVGAGDGGVFPPNLPVGRLVALPGGTWRVALSADFSRLEFVRLLRYSPDTRIDRPGGLILSRPGGVGRGQTSIPPDSPPAESGGN